MDPICRITPNISPSPMAGTKSQPPKNETEKLPIKPIQDQYIPEEKQQPSGRYYLRKDDTGRAKIYFDKPEPPSDKPDAPASDKAAGKPAESCTCNTDMVDREIEKLREEQEKLKYQLQSETDIQKRKELKSRFQQIEGELLQKDNDAYRRSHAVFS